MLLIYSSAAADRNRGFLVLYLPYRMYAKAKTRQIISFSAPEYAGGVQGQEHVLDVLNLSGAGIVICSEARRVASARAGLETRSRNITICGDAQRRKRGTNWAEDRNLYVVCGWVFALRLPHVRLSIRSLVSTPQVAGAEAKPQHRKAR
jgi:hypothetical protein